MMKTMLITGATSGIGEALAISAAQSGYKVIACGRNQQKLEALQTHSQISIRCFDVTDEVACKSALADVQCDIAVLNAGTCEYVDVDSWEPAMFKRVFEPNFFGIVNCVAALMPNLRAGNQIVVVDSLARLLPFSRSQAYGASKAALFYLTKSLEVDLTDKGIQVQSVSPGFVKTPLTDKNDFNMPMQISVEQAAEALLTGISKQQHSIYFPFRFSLILRLLGTLPTKWQRSIALYLKKNAAKE